MWPWQGIVSWTTHGMWIAALARISSRELLIGFMEKPPMEMEAASTTDLFASTSPVSAPLAALELLQHFPLEPSPMDITNKSGTCIALAEAHAAELECAIAILSSDLACTERGASPLQTVSLCLCPGLNGVGSIRGGCESSSAVAGSPGKIWLDFQFHMPYIFFCQSE